MMETPLSADHDPNQDGVIRSPEDHKILAEAITDPEEVRKYVKPHLGSGMSEDSERWGEIIKMIAESGALLKGHFLIEDD